MKQTAKKMIAVYLTLAGLAVEAESPSAKAEEDAIVQKYRIEYQNSHTLKKRLLSQFGSIEGFDGAGIERLKKRFDISDEIMRSVAMEIYTESLAAVKENRNDGIDGGLNTYRQQVAGALFCFGLSADQSTKLMLMAIVTDSATESSFRRQAISSYLRAADPEEAKNALLRFLVEGDRMDYMDRLSLYEYARMAYNQADEKKRAAILGALYIAVSRADITPWEFRDCDDILVKLSSEYSVSNERFSLLKKHNSATYPKMRERTKNEVAERFEKIQKLKRFTSISTNLPELKARNFNLPMPAGESSELTDSVSNSDDTESEKTGEISHRVSMVTLLGGIVIILIGFGVWKFVKK